MKKGCNPLILLHNLLDERNQEFFSNQGSNYIDYYVITYLLPTGKLASFFRFRGFLSGSVDFFQVLWISMLF